MNLFELGKLAYAAGQLLANHYGCKVSTLYDGNVGDVTFTLDDEIITDSVSLVFFHDDTPAQVAARIRVMLEQSREINKKHYEYKNLQCIQNK